MWVNYFLLISIDIWSLRLPWWSHEVASNTESLIFLCQHLQPCLLFSKPHGPGWLLKSLIKSTFILARRRGVVHKTDLLHIWRSLLQAAFSDRLHVVYLHSVHKHFHITKWNDDWVSCGVNRTVCHPNITVVTLPLNEKMRLKVG